MAEGFSRRDFRDIPIMGAGVVGAATGSWLSGLTRPMRRYATATLSLIALYPLLPPPGRPAVFAVVCVSALPCLVHARRGVRRRTPWTLLLWSMVTILVASIVLEAPDGRIVAAGWLIDAAGNILILAAAVAFILPRGRNDPGGIIDIALITLAAGGLLWWVLPHRIGEDHSMAAQANLLIVLLALSSVLGALFRLVQYAPVPGLAHWWLAIALGSAFGANVASAIAGSNVAITIVGEMLFMGAYVGIGLFGLDPSALALASPSWSGPVETLSGARLLLLGAALALPPVAIGIRISLGIPISGLLVAVPGALNSMLVMLRIWVLSKQRVRAERALIDQAAQDPLTRLLNRREFVARFQRELTRGSQCVLLFCDLDGFKDINDRFGHAAGDELLIEVARRLRTCVREPGLLSRFGGDEFAVLLVDATLADGQATRDCISDALALPFPQAGDTSMGVSIGLAVADEARDAERLIRSADREMYRVKSIRSADRRRAARSS